MSIDEMLENIQLDLTDLSEGRQGPSLNVLVSQIKFIREEIKKENHD
jgi:hypothetical protein